MRWLWHWVGCQRWRRVSLASLAATIALCSLPLSATIFTSASFGAFATLAAFAISMPILTSADK